MSGRHECRCGKPIHDGAHLCGACTDRLRDGLRKIASRWDDLEKALISSEPGAPGEGHRGRSTSTGLAINERVSRVRRQVSDLMWFVVQVIRDDCDDLKRPFAGPPSTDPGAMAEWVAQWQIPHITGTTAQETAEEIADDVHRAERATWNALEPARWVNVNLTCDQFGTSDMGERVPCEGTMRAHVGRGVLPDLVCSQDPSHTVSPAQWERSQWRRTKELDEHAMKRLVRQIVS